MRKDSGRKVLRAFAGALLLASLTAASVVATPSPTLTRNAAVVGQPTFVSLGAALDRAAVAPPREHARVAAIEAAFARAHPAPKAVVHKAAPKASKPVVRNHLWIPALGISRSIAWFPCTRSTAPGPYVYRWGCAGRNNVYLLGHASGVFRALHDAYLSGRLYVGMIAIYADGRGRLHHYRVTGWKVVSPSDISWASATRTQTMTLQTCVGPNSIYRLDVRLDAY